MSESGTGSVDDEICSSWNELAERLRSLVLGEASGGGSEDEFHKTPPSEWLFRGQSDSSWRLKSSLERAIPSSDGQTKVYPVEDYLRSVFTAKHEIEAHSGTRWAIEFDDAMRALRGYKGAIVESLFSDRLAPYLVYLRHFGFPSPLLDWTASPFVAAHFACRRATEAHGDEDRVAIFAYQHHREKPGAAEYLGAPTVGLLGHYLATHPRHFQQRANYTFAVELDESDGWYFSDLHSAISKRSSESVKNARLKKFILPASECRAANRYLEVHGVTRYSLFQDDDSLIESIWQRERLGL